jgi:hypothetical protein
MPRPDEKDPGIILCAHCGEHEGKIACPACRFLVCGPCLDVACPARPDEEPPAVEEVAIDHANRVVRFRDDSVRFADVLEVIVERVSHGPWSDLRYEYRVRLVLGSRTGDFAVARVRAAHRMRDLEALFLARGEALAAALGVKLRVERS